MAPSATNDAFDGDPTDLDFSTFSNVINGKLTSAKETRHGINPATEEPLPEVPVATPADVDAAIDAAKEAFKSWSRVSWSEREKSCLDFAEALGRYKQQFAKLLTREQGKPINFANDEVDMAINWIKTVSSFRITDTVIEEDDNRRIVQRYMPLGVVVGLVPWNYPVVLAVMKIGPSVMAGCPIIIKPSPFTPYCDLKLVELAQQFFPPGVIQVLSGDDNLGPWLTNHPGPAKISFTGSTFTGKKVMESASKTLKRVTLELGGNDPTIVCDDVDIKAVSSKVATFAFLNSGQICLAIKRIYVHEKIYDQFREAMVEFTKTLKVGEGNEGVFMGPIQNKMQYERVKGFFSEAEKSGQRFAIGGKNDDKPGYFINPTIVDNPKPDSRLVMEEPFGPIVPLMPWSSEEEVVTMANNTNYGLGASVWSSDVERAERIAEQLDAGTVWVNTHFELTPIAPFGGHKESGIGYEFSESGLKAYCNVQTLYVRKKL